AAVRWVGGGAAVDLIAWICSELPIDVYRGRGTGRVRLSAPGSLDAPAGDGTGRQDWCSQVLVSWLLRGNAYGLILQRSTAGHLQQADLVHPDKVSGYLKD